MLYIKLDLLSQPVSNWMISLSVFPSPSSILFGVAAEFLFIAVSISVRRNLSALAKLPIVCSQSNFRKLCIIQRDALLHHSTRVGLARLPQLDSWPEEIQEKHLPKLKKVILVFTNSYSSKLWLMFCWCVSSTSACFCPADKKVSFINRCAIGY